MGKNKTTTTTTTTTNMKGAAEKRRRPRAGPALSVSSPPEDSVSVSPCPPAAASCPTTPKRRRGRGRQDARLTSTPVHSSSSSLSHIPEELVFPERITHVQRSEVDPSQPRPQNTCRTTRSSRSTKQLNDAPPVRLRRGRRRRKEEQEETQQEETQQEETPSAQRLRPRFELKSPDSAERADESLQSSDLSIELSLHEDTLVSFQEDEDEEDELPSFLMQAEKKPPSITEGVFVWSKYRNYPFWPALVKSVNRKLKKASIIFIDSPMIHQKKGITVSLRSLKPFDCKDANELVCTAKENYNAAIEWSLELITDYRIRIACGSFSGSFIEYFAHDMSYPVRRKSPEDSDRLTIASEESMTSLCDEDSEEQQEEQSRSSKRLLPDRSHAAHNRANEKLVNFIVRQRMVERRLLAVIHGQQQSRWLRSFLSSPRTRVVNVYLEDDQQLDQVYCYLNALYGEAQATSPCLAHINSMRRVPFVLDVLLPEAIIYAIAGVDNVPVKKAEEKYLKGRSISNRERQEFDLMIEQEMKSRHRDAPRFVSDTNAVAD